MPAVPIRLFIRLLICLTLLLGIGGCVAPGEQDDNPLAQSVDDVITRLGVTLPGQYSNFAQHRQQGQSDSTNRLPLLTLSITQQEIPGRFLVVQSAAQQSLPERQFIWQFSRTPRAELQLDFAPFLHDAIGQSCQLILLPSRDGISGTTDQQQCRLPNRENQAIGLLKEFLLSPNHIELGERVYNLDTGAAMADDLQLEFNRQVEYKGWAGRLNESAGAGEDQWLLAQPFILHNQGDSVELFDNADRSIGYRVELARIVYRADQPEVMRLAVIDISTGKQTAYVWTSVDASQIGINLGWLQVGMELITDDQ